MWVQSPCMRMAAFVVEASAEVAVTVVEQAGVVVGMAVAAVLKVMRVAVAVAVAAAAH